MTHEKTQDNKETGTEDYIKKGFDIENQEQQEHINIRKSKQTIEVYETKEELQEREENGLISEDELFKDIILKCPNCNKTFNWTQADIRNQLCDNCMKGGLKLRKWQV